MAPRAGAQTLCCNAPAASGLATPRESPPGVAGAAHMGDDGADRSVGSLESAPASGEVDLLGDSRAHVDHLHNKGSPFGSLDSASAVASTVKGGASFHSLVDFFYLLSNLVDSVEVSLCIFLCRCYFSSSGGSEEISSAWLLAIEIRILVFSSN